jgi:hypothetical protein
MVKTTGGGVTEARKAKLGAAKVEITEKTPQPTDEWVSKLARAAVAKRAPLMSERKRDKMELKALEGEVTAALVENAQLLEKYGDTKGAVEVWDKLIDRWGSAPWAWSIAGSAQYALSEKMRIVAEHGPLP